MGDRANVKLQSQGEAPLFIYTHWHGRELPARVQAALAKRWRWDDEVYLNRIIFSEIIKDEVGEETGYGLSTFITDGENRVITVDHDKKTVEINGKTWSFDQFVDLDIREIGF